MAANADVKFPAIDSNLSTVYAAGQKPIGWVKPGEVFKLETLDCFSGRFSDPSGYTEENVAWIDDNENILTGPVAVEGAHPGDVVAVTVHDIQVTTPANWVLFRMEARDPGSWWYEGYSCESMPISDGRVQLGHGISAPIRPLIGCIGIAPRPPESIRNIKEGTFGGNMDCPDMGIGMTMYLPSENEGGLLYFGDCKCISGYGELVAPPEIGTILTLSAEVRKRPASMSWPRFENADTIFTVASEQNSSTAQRTAMREMLLWLEEETGAPRQTIAHVLGAVANAVPCQTSCALHTAHVSLPRDYFESLKRIGGR